MRPASSRPLRLWLAAVALAAAVVAAALAAPPA